MTNQGVKVGVVGTGALGQHHARIYSELAGCTLVGVYDVDPERAAEIAGRHQATPFTSLADLASAVDAVSVVVPTDRHREVAGFLIEQGVHVLIEKPIAATTAEAEELVELARAHQVLAQVGHVERFNPVLSYLEDAARNPRFIEAHRLAPYPPPREGLHPRGTEVSVVLDLMIHDIEVILHLVRSPLKALQAVGAPVLSPTEDIANVRLAFENGCVANITASRISPERMRKIRVFLDDAYISLDYQNQSGELYRKREAGFEREDVPIEKGEPLANQLQSFVQCVAARSEPVVSAEHAAEALHVAVRVMKQLREGAS